MDAETIGLIIGGILVALVGGAGAGRYLLPWQRRSQGETPPDPGITNTGPVKALDFVTEGECRETRKELTESLEKSSDEIKTALGRQTDTLNTLTQAVTKLEAKVEAMPVEVENASMKAIQGHESRFHNRRANSDFPRGNK